ncbi:MAG: aminoglycoside phosphotransferase family protein [Ruminococcus sp.]|nr:aminoglycoside phosphotransferase family protein [Ruminococcus sp.]
MTELCAVARRFGVSGDITVSALTEGHINDTYKLKSPRGTYVLQRLNTAVFRHPEAVMHNIAAVCGAFAETEGHSTSVPDFLEAGGRLYLEADGFWRMYSYVPGGAADRRQAGRAFGELMRITDGITLADSGLRLHDITGYFTRLTQLGGAPDMPLLGELTHRLAAIFSDELPRRNVHGDAKIANVLTGERCTLLDLDTLSRGWAALDFGDTVRSSCPENPDIPTITDIARGYAEGMQGLLAPQEISSLSDGILYVTAELAMRYYIDAASGEGYFKGKTPAQCLARADGLMTQLRGFLDRMDVIRTAVSAAFEVKA